MTTKPSAEPVNPQSRCGVLCPEVLTGQKAPALPLLSWQSLTKATPSGLWRSDAEHAEHAQGSTLESKLHQRNKNKQGRKPKKTESGDNYGPPYTLPLSWAFRSWLACSLSTRAALPSSSHDKGSNGTNGADLQLSSLHSAARPSGRAASLADL